MKRLITKIKTQLQKLSFRTGVVLLVMCVPFYILSFSQMALPIIVKAKGVLWAVLFGLAKTFQYAGITVLGVEGVKRIKSFFKKKKT